MAGQPASTLRIVRFAAVMLAALALTMGSAHVLELPQKMHYDAEMYSAVNTTLYRLFAMVGAVYILGCLVCTALLAYMLRRRPSACRWTLLAVAFFALSFASWLALVALVNSTIAAAMAASPETVPALWMELRTRWEYGHVVGFALHLVGLAALVWSILVETPTRADANAC